MRLHWLLPSFLGIILLSSPAEAARLQSWQFNANQNQLDFTTDDGVQPRAQLIANPTRLVIDLPGTKVGGALRNQLVGGAIRSIRVGQFDPQTTRIVVELTPGYTLDPQQVKFRGRSANQWSVQLPTPQPVSSNNPGVVVPGSPVNPTPPATSPVVTGATTQIQNVQVTPDGIFVRTTGRAPEVKVDRSNNGQQIEISLKGTAISPRLTQRSLSINRYGVSQLQVTQAQASPPVARITLNVARSSPNWQATVSNLGGVVLVPTGGVTAATVDSQRPTPNNSRPVPTSPPDTNQVATIEAVDLENNGNQLLIRGDRSFTYTTGWDRNSGLYRITLNSARLADRVRGPKLDASSALLRVRVRQEDPQTVVILLQPAAGVQVGDINQPSNQILALQLQRSRPAPVLPPGSTVGSIPVPPPTNRPPTTNLPRVPNGRLVVIVDPGHGGPDPGAVGIGGLQEKGITMDISRQVAARLQQQGVQAVLTREDDRDLDLEPRVALAERANASLFVSIHANAISMSRPDVNGLETYYYSSGERLARTIHSNVLQGTGARDRGVRSARFFVLRKTSMPSVLVEVGFVTGAEDAARLSTSSYRTQMADAIARGVLQYIQQNF
ncbi:N-acetylmuramoyl-L-alanine amidase [Trichocoleus desertorum AS-A10]|uniref:N-acetylmuramoyl-L-alanine amidase n=1 Tax=Trichocoleus desertorum TaxID=1481672 RepID=UPI0032993AD9